MLLEAFRFKRQCSFEQKVQFSHKLCPSNISSTNFTEQPPFMLKALEPGISNLDFHIQANLFELA